MGDMVERVARIIWKPVTKCDLRGVSNGPCSLGAECSCWPQVTAQARAAIDAIFKGRQWEIITMRFEKGDEGLKFPAALFSEAEFKEIIGEQDENGKA